MDEKVLMAISAQLTYLQLQIDGLLTLFLLHHPQERALAQLRLILDGHDREGAEIQQAVRDRIRAGVVIQELVEMGFGHLWGDREPPEQENDQAGINPTSD